ncbi:hypothetical protein X749_31625 [Mesorhizobium sp. LNJC391B00]|nr:hypothetical protein X749_31625 [Mesorhizobium sp. LNJC391B00]
MVDMLAALVNVALDIAARLADSRVAGRRIAAMVNARQLVPIVADCKIARGSRPEHHQNGGETIAEKRAPPRPPPLQPPGMNRIAHDPFPEARMHRLKPGVQYQAAAL